MANSMTRSSLPSHMGGWHDRGLLLSQSTFGLACQRNQACQPRRRSASVAPRMKVGISRLDLADTFRPDNNALASLTARRAR